MASDARHDGSSAADLTRLRRLRVPVIVRLARRRMKVSSLRSLSVGTIIEFEKGVGEPLDLLINNRAIGRGECVKIGESFGLRIQEIVSRRARVLSLGGVPEPAPPVLETTSSGTGA